MDIFTAVMGLFGGTATAILIVTYLSKLLVTHLLKRDLERVKIAQKAQADEQLKAFEDSLRAKTERDLAAAKEALTRSTGQELERLKSELSLVRDQAGWAHAAASARNERLRSEVLRWANPILGAVKDLKSRLYNILANGAEVALNPGRSADIETGWSIRYDYFMPSTLYLFGQYFYWVRRLQVEMSFEMFTSHSEKDDFFRHIDAVRAALGDWPMRAWNGERAGDAQVFSLQQRAIAAAMTIRKDDSRCIDVDEFMEGWLDPPMADALAPLRTLLESVDSNSRVRWFRLQQVLIAIENLENHCRALLALAAPPASSPGPAGDQTKTAPN